jgi:hypothetical protein
MSKSWARVSRRAMLSAFAAIPALPGVLASTPVEADDLPVRDDPLPSWRSMPRHPMDGPLSI